MKNFKVIFLNVALFGMFSFANAQINTSTGGSASVLPNSPTTNNNVGIGTSNPTEKLEVAGAVKGYQGIFDFSQPNGMARNNNDDFVSLSAGSRIGTGPGYEKGRMFRFYDFPGPTAGSNTGSTAYFAIEDRNDFGRYRMVANTGGSTYMILMDKSQAEFFKVNDDGADNISMQMGKPNSQVIIGGYANYAPGLGHKLVVQNGSALIEGNIITNSNIMIGTTNSVDSGTTYRLSVKGKIRAEEVKVYNTWADYVFAKDYKLKSLEEVENYIGANGHLPNVPSAKEVIEKGLELGEMAKIQQEKIEELTLYLIQQNKQIEELKAQVKLLLEKK